MNRNKTLRRSSPVSDVSGARIRFDFSVNDNLNKLLDTEAGTAFKKPWHRLERGLRLNRIRLFSDEMATQRSLKPEEKEALFSL